MNRRVYSLLLMDDVIRAVDRLAYAQNTSRSNMINQILAEYLSVKTPEQRMHDIFEQIQMQMDRQNVFQIQLQPSDAMLSVRTALAYKYKPTVRYCVELFRSDPEILGELRVSARTQNAGLLRMLDSFFRLWDQLERTYLADRLAQGVQSRIENGRYCRSFFWPQQPCTNSQLGEAISAYIQTFDSAMKAFFALEDENWREGMDQICQRYQDTVLPKTILI